MISIQSQVIAGQSRSCLHFPAGSGAPPLSICGPAPERIFLPGALRAQDQAVGRATAGNPVQAQYGMEQSSGASRPAARPACMRRSTDLLIAVIRYRKIMKWRTASLVFWCVAARPQYSAACISGIWFVDVLAGAALACISFYAAEKLIRRRCATIRSSSGLETADAGIAP